MDMIVHEMPFATPVNAHPTVLPFKDVVVLEGRVGLGGDRNPWASVGLDFVVTELAQAPMSTYYTA